MKRKISARVIVAFLAATLASPLPVQAQQGEYRVAGSYGREPGGLKGELVPVFVPWEGVNARGEILRCLTGPYTVQNDLLTLQQPDRLVRLRLKSGEEGAWELLESDGACAGLSGSGSYRITQTPMVRLTGQFDLAAPPQVRT